MLSLLLFLEPQIVWACSLSHLQIFMLCQMLSIFVVEQKWEGKSLQNTWLLFCCERVSLMKGSRLLIVFWPAQLFNSVMLLFRHFWVIDRQNVSSVRHGQYINISRTRTGCAPFSGMRKSQKMRAFCGHAGSTGFASFLVKPCWICACQQWNRWSLNWMWIAYCFLCSNIGFVTRSLLSSLIVSNNKTPFRSTCIYNWPWE